jgi:hypothetical protein
LSYSSVERVVVTRVAVELLLRGFSVWLDKWERAFGEAIRPQVEAGIGGSDFLLLFLSPSAVASAWVRNELEIALQQERALNRTFIIPILVASCEVPASLAGRIYADFSQGAYLEQLEELVRYLQQLEPSEGNQTVSMIPLRYFENLYFDTAALTRWLGGALPRVRDPLDWNRPEVLVDLPNSYRDLRRDLLKKLQAQQENARASAEWIQAARETYQSIEELEDRLEVSVAAILAGLSGLKSFGPEEIGVAVGTTAQFVAVKLLSLLLYPLDREWCLRLGLGDVPPFPRFAERLPLGTPWDDSEVALAVLNAGRYLRLRELETCDVWLKDSDQIVCKAFVPASRCPPQYGSDFLLKTLLPIEIAEWIVPCMVLQRRQAMTWDFVRCYIAIT